MKTFQVHTKGGAPFTTQAESIENVMAAISNANVFRFDVKGRLVEAGWSYYPDGRNNADFDQMKQTYKNDKNTSVRKYSNDDRRFIVSY